MKPQTMMERNEAVMDQIKILAVDDDEEFLEELKGLLSLSGYDVTTLSKNDQILDTIDRVKPDILVLDLKMTPKSGFQIASEIRYNAHWKNMDIIAISGNFKEKEHQTMTHLCGINHFLTKPIHPLNLIAHIERICKK